MAAPSGIVWGSVADSYGRIGIYVSLSSTSTTTTVTIEVWFWTKYNCTDDYNTFYFNNNASTATTSKGSLSLKTTVKTGSGWSTTNQIKIATYTYSYSRGTSASTKNCAAKLTGVEATDGVAMTCTTSYTIPALASYKVSYNANGGSGAPSAQTKYYGKSLTLSSTKPTRSGYTFVGWGTSASDTSSNYSAGGSYTANSAITLYAIWKKTIKLTYNANSGSGVPESQSATVYNATTSYKFTLSSTIPTRTGYTFLGWSTSSSATSATYSAGGTITLSASDTIYAVWKINSYKLTVKPNGGSWNGSTSDQSFTQNYNTTKSISAPTRTGYTFSGWTKSGSGSIAGASNGATTYTFGTGAGTLTAKWSINSYTLTLNPNGGTMDGSTSADTVTENYNTSVTLPSPTRTGYTLLGWSTSSSATSATYSAGESYSITKDVTLYAVWKINSYELTVKPNGGTWNNSTSDQSFTQNYNTTKTIANPTWTGHTFSGWTKSGYGTLSGTAYTFGAGAGTLTAKWDTIIYTLLLNPNGGTLNGSTASQEVTDEYGTTITLPTPTRTGYTLLGWSASNTATTASYNAGASYTISKNEPLYAVWRINSYTLTVNPNGGTWNDSTSSQSFTQNYNTTKNIPTPTRTGHTFNGWAKEGYGTLSETTYTFGAGEGKLTAKWTVNSHEVTFDASTNGGNMSDGTGKDVVSMDYGSNLGTLPIPVKKNYLFLGWFTSASGGTKVTDTYTVTKNITLYAQYEIDASAYVNDDKTWRTGVVFVTDKSGKIKKGHAKTNVNGVWKDGLCK